MVAMRKFIDNKITRCQRCEHTHTPYRLTRFRGASPLSPIGALAAALAFLRKRMREIQEVPLTGDVALRLSAGLDLRVGATLSAAGAEADAAEAN